VQKSDAYAGKLRVWRTAVAKCMLSVILSTPTQADIRAQSLPQQGCKHMMMALSSSPAGLQ
jgi:hypothetical protein